MNVDKLGLGVMIHMLSNNAESVLALQLAIGETISKLYMQNDHLIFEFENGYKMGLYDGGQSCCEHRYMTTDDALEDFVGAKVLSIEIKDAPEIEDTYGVHEVQFLHVNTSIGTFVCESHNEHNGYYGGFYIMAYQVK